MVVRRVKVGSQILSHNKKLRWKNPKNRMTNSKFIEEEIPKVKISKIKKYTGKYHLKGRWLMKFNNQILGH